MAKVVHKIFITSMVMSVILVFTALIIMGLSYYNTSLQERFYHEDYVLLKPSGIWGHGLGIIGSLFILIGVFSYIVRKRSHSLQRLGVLKHWLEFHIFLCTLGPILVLFHTTFKFGGLVAISFWSMVAVFLSGIIGRFIYIQIPRSIEGRELSLNEIRKLKSETGEIDGLAIGHDEISLNRRIERIKTMQKLFRYWHVAHLPFALVMLIIMIIHVVVTVVLGFRWIF